MQNLKKASVFLKCPRDHRPPLLCLHLFSPILLLSHAFSKLMPHSLFLKISYSCLREFALAVFSTWNSFPPDLYMAVFLIFRVPLKCQHFKKNSPNLPRPYHTLSHCPVLFSSQSCFKNYFMYLYACLISLSTILQELIFLHYYPSPSSNVQQHIVDT